MAASRSYMLISDNFAFWLRCEAATAKVRYSGELRRKHPRARLPLLLFDLRGSSLSLFRFIYGDESGATPIGARRVLKKKICSEIVTSNSLFNFEQLIFPSCYAATRLTAAPRARDEKRGHYYCF